MTGPAETLKLRVPEATHDAHRVRLAGLRVSNHEDKATPPLIVERRDQDFIQGVLAELADPAAWAGLRATTPAADGGALRLFAPVQRVFNLALLEVFCEEPGQPRLDPRKIESAGLVIRRVAGARRHAWIKAGTKHFGWEPIDEEIDPEADKRAPTASVGHPQLDRMLPSNRRLLNAGATRIADAKTEVTEQVVPLFVAPPKVCAAAGKTLLFANIPVASNEQTESPPESPGYGQTSEERSNLEGHLVSYLKAGGPRTFALPGNVFNSDWIRNAAAQPDGTPLKTQYQQLEPLRLLLQQLHVEFDAFGDSAAAKALFAELNSLTVEFDQTAAGKTVTTTGHAGEFLRQARDVLLDIAPGASFRMPHRIRSISTARAATLFAKTLGCLDAQYRKLKPARGRYEADTSDAEPRYVLRAFVRVNAHRAGCAPRLVWSEYSQPFTIAPWYESAGAAPNMVPLPDLLDRSQLKKLKPNIAFVLPPKLAALLKSDPKKLRDGEGGGGIDLMWICSFSIPIITLCAFIVLNIFLQLLNLIFFWLPFLKICIPFPKSK